MTDDDWYSDDTATFGDRLAAAREALGMSQKELARRVGIGVRTLENWENDTSEPRANRLTMLSGLLGVSIRWLLTGAGQGVDAVEPDPVDAAELLDELRTLRVELTRVAGRVALVEKRLRASRGDRAA